MHIFHNWTKWQDSTFTDTDTGKRHSAQTKRCKACNKMRVRVISGERT